MSALTDAADFVFSVLSIAFFVMALFIVFHLFWGEKMTLLTPSDRQKPAPGRKFWIAYGVVLAVALCVYCFWFRR